MWGSNLEINDTAVHKYLSFSSLSIILVNETFLEKSNIFWVQKAHEYSSSLSNSSELSDQFCASASEACKHRKSISVKVGNGTRGNWWTFAYKTAAHTQSQSACGRMHVQSSAFYHSGIRACLPFTNSTRQQLCMCENVWLQTAHFSITTTHQD